MAKRISKKAKASAQFILQAKEMSPVQLSGKIREMTDSGIIVAYKKKRKQKATVDFFPYARILAIQSSSDVEAGAEVTITLRPVEQKIDGVEIAGGIIESPIENFIAVKNADGEILLVTEECAETVGREEEDDEDDDKPAKKETKKSGRGRKKAVVEDEEEDEDDEDEDDDEEDDEYEDDEDEDSEDDDEEDDDEEDEEEVKPVKKGKDKKPVKKADKKPSKKKQDDDDDDDDEGWDD